MIATLESRLILVYVALLRVYVIFNNFELTDTYITQGNQKVWKSSGTFKPRIFDRLSTNHVVKYYLSPRCRGLIVGLQTRPPVSSVILLLTFLTWPMNTIYFMYYVKTLRTVYASIIITIVIPYVKQS